MPSARNQFDSTASGHGSTAEESLVDMCSRALYLVFHIQGGGDPGHIDTLRKEISITLQDLDRRGKRHGHAEEDIKAARYALCALIDETILNSQWPFKDQWSDKPLQLEFFGEHMAGERFFDLLERIRQKGERKVDLMEVFCLALIFGFQGKYKLRGGDSLKALISELITEISAHRGGRRSLSPNWKVPPDAIKAPSRLIPPWVWITSMASVLLMIILFVVLRLWLSSNASEAASRMAL